MSSLQELVDGIAGGSLRIIDLTQPLSEKTPVIQLPDPFVDTPGFKMHELSCYDDAGPAWYWNSFEAGEHVGTHLDAPVHWISGRAGEFVDQIALSRLVGPAVVIDKSVEVAADPDYLLTIDDLHAFEQAHGPFPSEGWLLLRTGWDARAHDQGEFLNVDETGSHTPGLTPECARHLAQETPIIGIGVETVGTDAGGAHAFEPAFPCHHFMLGAGKYGLTQLANVGELPATGSVIVVAPLKIESGSGSPVRAFAFSPA